MLLRKSINEQFGLWEIFWIVSEEVEVRAPLSWLTILSISSITSGGYGTMIIRHGIEDGSAFRREAHFGHVRCASGFHLN